MSSCFAALSSRARPTFFRCDVMMNQATRITTTRMTYFNCHAPLPDATRTKAPVYPLAGTVSRSACGSADAGASEDDSTAALSCALASILAIAGSASPLANAGDPDAERGGAGGPFCARTGGRAARDGRAASAGPFEPAGDLTELAWRRGWGPALINAASAVRVLGGREVHAFEGRGTRRARLDFRAHLHRSCKRTCPWRRPGRPCRRPRPCARPSPERPAPAGRRTHCRWLRVPFFPQRESVRGHFRFPAHAPRVVGKTCVAETGSPAKGSERGSTKLHGTLNAASERSSGRNTWRRSTPT